MRPMLALCLLLLASCGDENPIEDFFTTVLSEKKAFYPDPKQPFDQPLGEVKIDNDAPHPITFCIDAGVTDAPVYAEPSEGILQEGETACVQLISRHPLWIDYTLTFQAKRGGEVVHTRTATVANGSGPALLERNRIFDLFGLLPNRPWTPAEGCNITLHSDGTMMTQVDPPQDLVVSDAATEDVDEEPTGSNKPFVAPPAFSMVEDGLVLEPVTNLPFQPGSHALLFVGVEGEIPFADPENHYQYACAFDADGDTGNNYVPPSAFPNDWFGGTDLWYEVLYNPTDGWTFRVTDARDNVFTPIASAARAIVTAHGITFLVPAGDFSTANPAYRLTAFCHKGDFGLNPPHVWSGDTQPPMAEPLADDLVFDPPALQIEKPTR